MPFRTSKDRNKITLRSLLIPYRLGNPRRYSAAGAGITGTGGTVSAKAVSADRSTTHPNGSGGIRLSTDYVSRDKTQERK